MKVGKIVKHDLELAIVKEIVEIDNNMIKIRLCNRENEHFVLTVYKNDIFRV